MKNYKIKTSFVSPKGPIFRANKTGINFEIFILIFLGNDAIHLSILRAGSNPSDIYRFQSHNGKEIIFT